MVLRRSRGRILARGNFWGSRIRHGGMDHAAAPVPAVTTLRPRETVLVLRSQDVRHAEAEDGVGGAVGVRVTP